MPQKAKEFGAEPIDLFEAEERNKSRARRQSFKMAQETYFIINLVCYGFHFESCSGHFDLFFLDKL